MIFVFGDYELDPDRIELRQAGKALAVEPQVFDVLVYLVENRSRVVTKNELLDNVWGDRFVSESALTSRIKAARRLVGDDGRSQHTIRTSHGRGYRFVAPVEERDGVAAVAGGVGIPAVVVNPPSSGVGSATGSTALAEPIAAHAPGVSRTGTGPTWPLVGRGMELELVARCYSDRDIGGVVLTGAAGLGKTRLAEECLAAASRGGVATARVTGNPEARNVSLGALAALVPTEIVALVGPDGDLDRTTLFHRARAAVTALAPEGERLMMLVDDVDQLDELSRALIGSLIVDGSVFALVTLRSGQGRVPTIDHLEKDGHLRRLDLTELDHTAIETLLYRVLGGPMVHESLEDLVAATLGNPGILRQLVDTARETGTLVESHGVWYLTGALRPSTSLEALVADRLRGVDGEARHAVELLAISGELGLDLLIHLVGVDAVDTVDRLGVVSMRVYGRRNKVALAHPLYGEVIRRQISTLRGRLLRRELADAVEAAGARRRDDEVRIVAWRMEGGGGQIEPRSLLRAARLALIDRNHDVARRLLEQACATDRSALAVQLLAELHFRLGDTATVEELLASIDTDELDDRRRAAIARRRANNRFFGTTDYQGSFELLSEAIETTADPEVRRGLEATLAQLLANGGQIDESLRWAESTLPRSSGAVRLEALRAYGLALIAAGRTTDALAAIREGRALHTDADDDVALPGLTMLLFSEAVALAEQGSIDEGRKAVAASRVEHPHGPRNWLNTALGRVELLAGRPRAVRRAVAPVIHETRARSMGATERWVLGLHACGWLLEGEVEHARADVERATALEDGPRGLFHPDIDRAKGWLAAYTGDLDAAVAQLLWSADDCRDRGAHGFELALLHDVARFGRAADVATRIVDLAGRVQGELAEARAEHVSGLVAADPQRLAKAATRFDRCGAVLFAAEAATAIARALGDQGRTGEAATAAERAESLRMVGGVRLVSPALDAVVT
jgi:DNA-binding winged helix-turn-helix (wHTH) protein/tetratricopeptide (TPR) repeat protein